MLGQNCIIWSPVSPEGYFGSASADVKEKSRKSPLQSERMPRAIAEPLRTEERQGFTKVTRKSLPMLAGIIRECRTKVAR